MLVACMTWSVVCALVIQQQFRDMSQYFSTAPFMFTNSAGTCSVMYNTKKDGEDDKIKWRGNIESRAVRTTEKRTRARKCSHICTPAQSLQRATWTASSYKRNWVTDWVAVKIFSLNTIHDRITKTDI